MGWEKTLKSFLKSVDWGKVAKMAALGLGSYMVNTMTNQLIKKAGIEDIADENFKKEIRNDLWDAIQKSRKGYDTSKETENIVKKLLDKQNERLF